VNQLERTWGPLVVKYRWLVILLTLGVVVASASGARFLTVNSDYRVFFSAENPQLQEFDRIERTYTKNDNILFVVTPKGDNIFNPQTLSAIKELTDLSWKIPYSIRVDSIANFQHSHSEEDDLIVEALIDNTSDLDQERINKIQDISLNEPLLVNRMVSSDKRIAGVNVTFQLPGKELHFEVPSAVAKAREIKDTILAKYPDLSIKLVGGVMMNNAFNESSMKDMQSLIPLSYLLMFAVLWLLVRGFSGVLLTLIVIAFSVVISLGLGGYIGVTISPPVASSPVIILTIAIANTVHILVSLNQALASGKEKFSAIYESVRVNLQPVFLTSLTTAIGFLTMNFSEVPPFKDLGNVVAIGVMSSFFLATLFVPAVLSLIKIKPRQSSNSQTFMEKFGGFVVKNKKPLLISSLILAPVLSFMASKNELNDIFVHYFDQSVEFRQDTDYASQNLTGSYIFDISLDSGASDGISDPNFLTDVERLAQWFKQRPEATHVNSFTETVKRLNRNMHGDNQDWYKLPTERDLAAQYILLYEMSLPYGLDLNNQLDIKKSSTRLLVTLDTLSTKQVLNLERETREFIDNNLKSLNSYIISGPTLMFGHISYRNIVAMLTGTAVALILISAILLISLRSVKIGLISLVPNLIPALMGFGVWALFVGEIGLAVSVVASVTLGIVVDDTVHFLSKYLRARRELNMDSGEAVVYAFKTVGKALMTTSAILISGFLILAMSSFELNSSLGALSSIVIFIALVADFLLLPPLLMLIEGKRNEKAPNPV